MGFCLGRPTAVVKCKPGEQKIGGKTVYRFCG
jgi:hypothetical protein